MRDWLRRRLDSFESRAERRDEEFAALVNRNLNALADRKTLKIYIGILAGINFLIWASVVLLPNDIENAWSRVNELDDKITAILIAIIFGLGFWLTYSLCRLRFPDLEDPKYQKTVFASFQYAEHSTKRWRVWLVSTVGGVMNVLFLLITEIYRAHGY